MFFTILDIFERFCYLFCFITLLMIKQSNCVQHLVAGHEHPKVNIQIINIYINYTIFVMIYFLIYEFSLFTEKYS